MLEDLGSFLRARAGETALPPRPGPDPGALLARGWTAGALLFLPAPSPECERQCGHKAYFW